MTDRTIYIVMGTTGEYSDRTEWPVVAVPSEDEAKKYISALQLQSQSVPPALRESRWENRDKIREIVTLDPSYEEDYTGTSWFFYEVKLIDSDAVRAAVALAA